MFRAKKKREFSTFFYRSLLLLLLLFTTWIRVVHDSGFDLFDHVAMMNENDLFDRCENPHI